MSHWFFFFFFFTILPRNCGYIEALQSHIDGSSAPLRPPFSLLSLLPCARPSGGFRASPQKEECHMTTEPSVLQYRKGFGFHLAGWRRMTPSYTSRPLERSGMGPLAQTTSRVRTARTDKRGKMSGPTFSTPNNFAHAAARVFGPRAFYPHSPPDRSSPWIPRRSPATFRREAPPSTPHVSTSRNAPSAPPAPWKNRRPPERTAAARREREKPRVTRDRSRARLATAFVIWSLPCTSASYYSASHVCLLGRGVVISALLFRARTMLARGLLPYAPISAPDDRSSSDLGRDGHRALVAQAPMLRPLFHLTTLLADEAVGGIVDRRRGAGDVLANSPLSDSYFHLCTPRPVPLLAPSIGPGCASVGQ